MNEIISKSSNNNLIIDSSKKQISLIKLNSSKLNSSILKRNSYSYMIDKFRDEYQTKYFELYNKSIKGDTSKNSGKNKNNNKSNIKYKKYINRPSAIISTGNSNNLNNYLEKLYQNDKHMKKNILKKKKIGSNKLINPKVSFLRNLTKKNDSLRNSSKKIHHSTHKKKEFKDNKNSESKNKKENIIEKEDEQEYGFNKKYKIKMFDELDEEKNRLNEAIHNTKIIQTYLFKRNKENDIESETKKMNKTFIIPKIRDSEIQKLRDSFLKLKSKKTLDNNNFKKINRKLIRHKKVRLKQKRSNKVVNINYNINVNGPNNDKHKNDTIKKKETSKKIKIINITENINKPELLIINKNKEGSNTNKTSNNKENNNKDKDNTLIKDKKNNIFYKYMQNCCFPFVACLKGNND